MIPVFIVGEGNNAVDIAKYIGDLKPVRNDLDKDGSGRDITDGYFYRERIAQKKKWSVSFIPLSETEMYQIANLLDPQYLTITFIDPKTNAQSTSQYYASSMDYGSQLGSKADNAITYVGASINVTER